MLDADDLRFFISWLRAPRTVASALPSSPALGRLIAAQLPAEGEGLVVELGGGTGAITRGLLDRGLDPARVVVVERSPEFAQVLRRKFPDVHVLNADAQMLRFALAEAGLGQPVHGVVSGLPLLTLPDRVCERILGEVAALLPPGRQFLQFTYGWRSPVPPAAARGLGMRGEPVGRVWLNLPPATVWAYTFGAAGVV